MSLFALHEAGTSVTSDVYRKGVAFLLRNQYHNGAWFVKTRAYPVQPYFESGYPFGRNQWISAAGASWASLAIAMYRPRYLGFGNVEDMIRKCHACGMNNRIPSNHLADQGRCGSCRAPLPAIAEPIEADAASFDEIVSGARVPVLIDFWAAWCGPCRTAAPEVQRAASQMAGRAIVLKVDTERSPALAQRFNVMSIPNFVVMKEGRVVHQQPGLVDHQQMISWLVQAGA